MLSFLSTLAITSILSAKLRAGLKALTKLLGNVGQDYHAYPVS